MTPVSFVKTTESYVKTTESYKVCRLGHHLGSTFTGNDRNGPSYRIGQDLRVVYSCNSWFVVTFQTVRLRPVKMQAYFIFYKLKSQS